MDEREEQALVSAVAETEQEFDYDRTVALSDGVFAIALTLLVLSIEVPPPQPGRSSHVWPLLTEQWREVLSYGVSVAVIGLLWMRHHAFFGELLRIDGRLTALNIGYLGLVAFLPFPTEMLGSYEGDPAAVAVYAATLALVAASAALMRWHADRAGLLTDAARREPLWSLALVPGVFLASIPLALVSPVIAQVSWLVLLAARVRRSTAA
jgi:uncharacterized membrane protein